MNKIRKGDQVIVIAGRDKGKRGTVTSRKCDSYLVIDGINMVKKHVKPNPMAGIEGGIVEKAMPIHQSNVAIYNAATGMLTVWVSKLWRRASACVSTNPVAKKSRWHNHGTFAKTLP